MVSVSKLQEIKAVSHLFIHLCVSTVILVNMLFILSHFIPVGKN